MGETYQKICKRCGKTFKTESKRGYVCNKCKSDNKRRRDLERQKPQQSPNWERKRTFKVNIPLFDMVKIIEEYNQSHGTHYTYGEFVFALESGLVIIDKGAEKS